MPLSQRLLSWLLALPLLIVANLGATNTIDASRLHFRGFATAGAVWGGNDQLGFRRDVTQDGAFEQDMDLATDSLLGLQLDAQVNDKLGGAVQLVIKDRLDDVIEKNVAWAFLRYRFNPDWTLRVGRIGLDVYLLSEYRNVGFSYLWARPPVEFYGPVAFDSFDGLDLEWSRPLGEGQFRAKLYTGRVTNDFLVLDVEKLELNPVVGLSFNWESQHWQLRMTAAQNQLKERGYFPGTDPLAEALLAASALWPEAHDLAGHLAVDRDDINYYSIGAAYQRAPWQIQAEVAFLDSEMDVYPTLLSRYLSVGRQLGPVTLYTMLADADPRKSARNVPAPPSVPELMMLADVTRMAFTGALIDQSSLSFGARWDIRHDMALKFQWDRSWVHQWATGLWLRKAVPADDQVLDTFSLNLNLFF